MTLTLNVYLELFYGGKAPSCDDSENCKQGFAAVMVPQFQKELFCIPTRAGMTARTQICAYYYYYYRTEIKMILFPFQCQYHMKNSINNDLTIITFILEAEL